MKSSQSDRYGRQISAFRQVKSVRRQYELGSGPYGWIIVVEDHLGNVSEIQDVCEVRSLIAIWRQQGVQAAS